MTQESNTQTLKIVWGALSFSLFAYGFILYMLKGIYPLPLEYSPLEKIALLYNFMAIITFFIYQKVIKPEKNNKTKATYSIVCWALNESVALMAFAAVFVNPTGSLMLYILNASTAFVGNVITCPRN